mmetsp:Transcript_49630/g.124787  ORF Transcript_49630/g.124787 Transcript_49630/m.124787 type:complete len:314 (+) Transcript_49630:324-1265(+)
MGIPCTRDHSGVPRGTASLGQSMPLDRRQDDQLFAISWTSSCCFVGMNDRATCSITGVHDAGIDLVGTTRASDGLTAGPAAASSCISCDMPLLLNLKKSVQVWKKFFSGTSSTLLILRTFNTSGNFAAFPRVFPYRIKICSHRLSQSFAFFAASRRVSTSTKSSLSCSLVMVVLMRNADARRTDSRTPEQTATISDLSLELNLPNRRSLDRWPSSLLVNVSRHSSRHLLFRGRSGSPVEKKVSTNASSICAVMPTISMDSPGNLFLLVGRARPAPTDWSTQKSPSAISEGATPRRSLSGCKERKLANRCTHPG